MGVTRYKSGDVTVTLDGGLEAFVRKALEAAGGETLRIMEAAGTELATKARSDWYGGDGVTKRTGSSGDIVDVTTVSDREVRVSIGSTDLKKAKYVHRPGRLSTRDVEITDSEYWAAKRAGGTEAQTVFRARKAGKAGSGIEVGRYYRSESNPKASDGKFLLAEFIRKPAAAKIKAITPELGRAIAARVKK